MALRRLRHLAFLASLMVLVVGLYSPINAQDTPPPPPPLPRGPTQEATTAPTNAPTAEPTATEVTPTEEVITPTFIEPTNAPTDVPTEAPTIEPTVLPTDAPTAEATVTSEPTQDVVTATPQPVITETPVETAEPSGGRDTRGGTHVQTQLMDLHEALASGDVAGAQSVAATSQLDVDSAVQIVHIEIIASDAAEAARLRPLIEGLGGVFLIGYERRLEFDFPILSLLALDVLPGNFYAIRPQEGRPTLGPNTSEGVQATGATQWHARGLDGTNVRIGVVDTGFNGYTGAETAGCVQAAVNFDPGETLTSEGDHGANVAQIICDMAPKAKVYLSQATTLSSLNAAVDWLISQNVNVINMSMRWDTHGAGDGNGEANFIIQRAINAGILWVNATGNSNGDTWNGNYTNINNPAGIPDPLFGAPDDWHNFGDIQDPVVKRLFGGASTDALGCPSGFAIQVHAILRWSDWNASYTGNALLQDYDLYVFYSDNSGMDWTFSGGSFDAQNPLDFVPPVEEAITLVPCAPGRIIGVAIQRFDAPAGDWMYLMTWISGPFENATVNTSISTPADSQDVLTVAAGEVKEHSCLCFPPFLGYPNLASYSSRGPILGPGGTDPGGALYPKPDVTAPTNVTTSLDPFDSFNGTSAASPHAAGFAALVYQANRTFFETFSGQARAQAVKNEILTNYLRFDTPTVDPNGFGQGIITLPPNWFSWTDALLQHTSGTIIRSGPGWAQQTQAGASGGNYAYTLGEYTRLEFGVAFASGVNFVYYQRPDLPGQTFQVYRNGLPLGGFNSLFAATPTQVTLFLPTSCPVGCYDLFTIVSVSGGLTMDYIQVQFGPPYTTLQENQLNTFGTWSRVVLSSASGGYHSTNNQRGAGVQFYTNDTEFTVTYTKRPDGGIMEIWVNGQLCTACGEIDTYSGSTLTSMQNIYHVSGLGAFGVAPYHVQLVNSGRHGASTTNRPYVTIDNIRFPLGGGAIGAPAALEAEVGYTAAVGTSFLPMSGTWTNMVAGSASGGRHFSTTTAGAEFRYQTTATRNFVFFSSSTSGATLEIWVNGQLCTACGVIDTYRSTAMYKIPYVFIIPGTFTSPYHITLRNTGSRNASATGTTATMLIDKIEVVGGLFQTLNLHNVTANDGFATPAGFFWLDQRWVAQSQTNAIGGDIYINNSSYNPIFLNTCSRDFTLLLAKNPNGGIVRVKLWNGVGYTTLAEFNGQATSTIWRYGLDVTIPTSIDPDCDAPGVGNGPFQLLIEVNANTQFGNTYDYGYADALLVNDGGALYAWTYSTFDSIVPEDVRAVEIGGAWPAFPHGGAEGGNVNGRNINGASLQFTVNNALSVPRLIYSRMPDGGIGEVWINGVFQFEISYYSPTPLHRQFLEIDIPGGVQLPAIVEIRVTNRRTTGSTGYYVYVDVIKETTSGVAFATPIIETGTQNNSPNLSLFGAIWTTLSAPPTTGAFPSGASTAVTTANSGGVRFRLTGSNRFIFVATMSANRGVAEVWVNGRLCTGCGTINTFRASTFWRVPFHVIIPTATFGSGPYFIEIRPTNAHSVGSMGYALDVDEIIPLSGGTIDWNGSLAVSVGGPESGTWSTINSSIYSLNGTFFRTILASTPSSVLGDDLNGDGYKDSLTQSYTYLTTSASQDEIILLRHTAMNGGIAEIWISDYDASLLPGDPYVFRLCFECGTINNYSSYARYQVPFYFQIPTRFDGDPSGGRIIRILNTSSRAATSTGYYLDIDGFMFP